MGLIRSGVVMFVSSLLFLGLFVSGLFLTLDWSLEYDTVKPQWDSFSSSLVEEMGVRDMLDENYELMRYYCQANEEFTFPVTESMNMVIPCSVVDEGPEAVISYGSEQIVEDIYYKEYNCSFVNCLKEQSEPFVLVSEKSQQFFHSKFILVFLATIVLFALMFLALESKHSVLTITGILMVVAALPFRKFNWIAKFLPDGAMEDLFLAFFTKSYNVFMIMAIVGVSMFIIGIAFEFLGFGVWFGKLFGLFKGKKGKSSSDKKGKIALAEAEENKDETSKLKDEVSHLKEEISKLKKGK
jgi:hypothetical protein